MPRRPLTRSYHNAVFKGVLSGIAEWREWDIATVRITFIILTLITGVVPGILTYLILWSRLPRDEQADFEDDL